MGYRNIPAYVQRQMDTLLRPHLHFTRAYVDDVVVFSKSLEDHLRHLDMIFSLFNCLQITLSPTKSFLGFPSTKFLGQHVDRFGLSTHDEKLRAIQWPELVRRRAINERRTPAGPRSSQLIPNRLHSTSSKQRSIGRGGELLTVSSWF